MNILYVEIGEGEGGSVRSLYYLIKNIDRVAINPTVIFYYQNSLTALFKELGVEVRIFESRFALVRYIIAKCKEFIVRYTHKLSPISYLASFIFHLFSVFPSALKLFFLIKKKNIDIVHLNNKIRVHRDGIVATKLAGIPCVCHERMISRLNRLDRFLSDLIDIHICISDAVKQNLLEQGISPVKVVKVHNAVDVEEIRALNHSNNIGEEFGIKADDYIVGLIGRLTPWKGQMYFLEAISLVKKDIPNIKGLIIGGAIPAERDYGNNLKNLAITLGIEKTVIFTGFRRDVYSLMSIMDCLVHCSTSPEPFGRVIIEGMAMSLPVIATEIGAIPEIIQNGVTGITIPPKNADAIASAILKLWKDRVWAKEIGSKALYSVKEKFDIVNNAAKTMNIYRLVLSEEHNV